MINKVELKKFSTTIISVLVLILLTSPTLFAQQQKVDGLVDRYVSEIIEIRHQIHQNPELGNREFETAKLIAEHLRSLGIEVTTGVAHTGVVGILKGGKTGSGCRCSCRYGRPAGYRRHAVRFQIDRLHHVSR